MKKSMKDILKTLQTTTRWELCLRHHLSHLKKMHTMLLSINCSTLICHWKSRENCIWSHCLLWSVRFNAPSREARVDSTDCSPNTPLLWVREIDICLPVRREQWTQHLTTWSLSTNKNSKRMLTVTWESAGQTSWELSFKSLTLRKTQRKHQTKTTADNNTV